MGPREQGFCGHSELGHFLPGTVGSAGFDDFNIPARELESLAKANELETIKRKIAEIRELSTRIRVPSNA